ncbi:Putative cysteine peptidase, cysteine active, peptidase C2, calpain, catalytic [Colletotrichum destructivum]|uniref:Cysteine peptidase, cysteine active, peptidase C2, calpain, catalytic n=1 Tax=Colletotrichum destructivum TaxID=34406 RepID=A0AAX4IGU2_9PEZI|nr:Putative cysteine peptidase, cysteine active, peptidase C2, calpain, catalytic [Colletotrichum destructivum]
MATYGDAPPPVPPPVTSSKRSKKAPQEILSDFWDKFHSKHPGKVTSVFPRSLYASLLPSFQARGASSARNAQESYEAAARECREKVKRIIRECDRTNGKYTDADFDIERDPYSNCLNGLIRDGDFGPGGSGAAVVDGPNVSSWDVKNSLDTLAAAQVLGPNSTIPFDPAAVSRFLASDEIWNPFANAGDRSGNRSGTMTGVKSGSVKASKRGGVRGGEWYSPGSIHRVDWIFESPQFTVNGYSSSDIKQGANGDCWWLAAVATIAHRKDLMQKICVARDEECGVYGFVFQRDGDWISTVIDDNLYLRDSDFDFYGDVYDASGKKARLHRKRNQTGSDALYFARCEDQNETWLPLLEKAYAKVHGDYEAISGGWPGEAVEDMTGGVTSTIATNRVLRKDKLWKELVNSDGEFVFALAAMGTGWDWRKSGLALGHAYSILQSREEVDEDGKKVRLVQIRNPWGERSDGGVGEWNGPWSDGSKEWTPYWLKRFNHTFGDDGVFWMSYEDMLSTFMYIHRTRLFDEKWTVVQQWTSANVSWVTGYLQTKFIVEVKKSGMVVIVLTQLDDRYFHGFEGQYWFELHFVLQKATPEATGDGAKNGAESKDTPEPEQICRVRPVHKWENRSVSCEVDLEPGVYEVLPKVTAARHHNGDAAKPVEDIVKEYAERNPQKLRQVGLQYDIAHAKGGVRDEDELIEKKKLEAKAKKESKKAKKKRKQRKALGIAAKVLEDSAKVVSDMANEGKKTDEAKSEVKAEPKTDSGQEKEKEKEKESTGSSQKPATIDDKPADLASSSKPAEGPTTEPKKPDEKKDENMEKKKEEKGEEAATAAEAPVVPPPAAEDAEAPEEASAEKEDSESETDAESTVEDDDDEVTGTPWNAVCVLGLRVYARDPDVAIKLTTPSDAEEASSLTVDGEAAGATA